MPRSTDARLVRARELLARHNYALAQEALDEYIDADGAWRDRLLDIVRQGDEITELNRCIPWAATIAPMLRDLASNDRQENK